MPVPSPSESTDNRSDLGHGVSCQWLHKGAIIAFYVTDVSREAVDVWGEAIDQAAELTPPMPPGVCCMSCQNFR